MRPGTEPSKLLHSSGEPSAPKGRQSAVDCQRTSSSDCDVSFMMMRNERTSDFEKMDEQRDLVEL